MRFSLILAIALFASVLAVDVRVYPTGNDTFIPAEFSSDESMTIDWTAWANANNGPFKLALFVDMNATNESQTVITLDSITNQTMDVIPNHEVKDWIDYKDKVVPNSWRWCVTDASPSTVCSANFEMDLIQETSFNFVLFAAALGVGLGVALILLAPVCISIPCAFYCVVQIAWSMALTVVCLIPLILYFSFVIFVSFVAGIAGGALFPNHETTKSL